MSDILSQILADKFAEVLVAKRARSLDALYDSEAFKMPVRDFFAAVRAAQEAHPALIAEIKARSPSAGVIRNPLDVADIARTYEKSGSAAISVLTDAKYFGGAPENIATAKAACGLPILRKEFIVDAYQIVESRALGADAILLIGEALSVAQVVDFARQAAALGLTVLIEGHSADVLRPIVERVRQENLSRVLIGINNRDLKRQVTDLAIFEEVAQIIGDDFPLVAESGIRTRADVKRLQMEGAAAMLVGETILKSPNIAKKISELLSGD